MAIITVDKNTLLESSKTLESLERAAKSEEIKNEDIQPMQRALTDEYGRMKDCEDNLRTASDHIATLERALAGWNAYHSYQTKRLPGLKRRYLAARDYIRSAEDEQTGNL